MPLAGAWTRLLKWLIVVPSCAAASCVDKDIPDVAVYVRECLGSDVYDKKLMPPTNGTLNVEVQFNLRQLNQVDQINGFVTIGGYFRQWWKDERLAYNGSVDHISLRDDDLIWVPDVYVDNLVEHDNPSGAFSSTKLVDISPDGKVWKSEMVLLKIKCSLKFGKIPFDEQECHVKVASYSEDTSVMRVFAKGGTPGTGSSGVALKGLKITSLVYEFMNDMEIEGVPGRVETEVFASGGSWDYLYLDFHFKRRPRYYTTLVIVPSILFLGVSYTGFWVSPKAVPARATVAVIPLLILLTLMNNVYSSLPQTYEMMWLVWYLLIDLSLALVAAIEFAGVQLLLEREGVRQEHLAMLKAIEPVVKTITAEAKKRGLRTLDLLAKIKEEGHTALEDIKVEVSPFSLSGIFRQPTEGNKPGELPMETEGGVHKTVTEADMAVIQFVEEIFESYDRDDSGQLSCIEVRKAMTYFNIWLCNRSAATVMCMFLRDLGEKTPENEATCSMRFGQFTQFLIVVNRYLLRVYRTPNLYHQFLQVPPSGRCDIIFRFIFPVLVFLANMIMLATLSADNAWT